MSVYTEGSIREYPRSHGRDSLKNEPSVEQLPTRENKIEFIKQNIRSYPHYPKEGIVFRDIFAALTNGKVCEYLKELLVSHVREYHPDVEMIVGLESRGFLFNFMIASELGVGCAPIRKKGKLPGDCIQLKYDLEYGSDIIEIQQSYIRPGMKVLIIDDLLATGGTMNAAVQLVKKAGGECNGCLVIMELAGLNGRNRVDCDVHSLIQY